MNKVIVFLFFSIFFLLIACVSNDGILVDVNIEPRYNESQLELENSPRNFEWLQYQVQRGDTLASVANQFGVSIEVITTINKLQQLRELDFIRVPNTPGTIYVVESGEVIFLPQVSCRP